MRCIEMDCPSSSPRYQKIESLLSAAAEQLDADGVTLWIEEEGFLRAVANPLEPKIIGIRQPLDRGIISEVFLTGQGIVETSPESNPSHDPGVDKHLGKACREIMAVAFASGGREGVVSAVRHHGEHRFGVESLNIMNRLATELSDSPIP